MNMTFPRTMLLLFFLFSRLLYGKDQGDYSSSSVLSTGKWFRIAVTSEGIYRLDYSLIRQTGVTDPSNPRIFGNNAGQLSYYNKGSFPDDLKEIPVYISTGNDGIFNEGDYLLFYGQSTHRWNYNHAGKTYSFLRHNYSDTAFYFLTSGIAGKRVTDAVQPQGNATYNSTASDELFCYEAEIENLITSGREWFQRIPLTGISIKPAFSDLVESSPVKMELRVAGRSSKTISFGLYEGSTRIKEAVTQPVNLTNPNGTYAAISDSISEILPLSASPEYEIRFNGNGENGAVGWIDYLRLQARTRNVFSAQTRFIRDKLSVAPANITSFSVTTAASDVIIWDVTDPYNVKNITYSKSGSSLTFKAVTDSLRTYAVFAASAARVPVVRNTPVANQDLHASAPAGMVIVTHPLFRNYARRIADMHYTGSGLVSLITTPEEIYNEFSGGVPDIVAIRNFIRMKYLKQKDTGEPLRYLLLFGDGSVENKTPPPRNPNFIPTYQTQNSNVVVSSFTSDDFYGLLEDGEGEAEGTDDIGIGRFPVYDTAQAGIIVRKVRNYLDPSNMGAWRNVITITADDEDGNTHMTDAEGLDAVIRQKTPEYTVDKIYLDAYRQVTSVNGQSYPDVNKAITDRINRGCLIFNYVGHGSEMQLAHERVVTNDDIRQWKNGGKLPLFITATCEFSRFDNVEINLATREMIPNPSSGELALLNSEGGAIALMSTTRIVYSAPNYQLNRNIFSCAFDRDSQGNPLALGDIIRTAKNNSGNGSNKRNFSLLGDPALRLAYPWHGKVITDSVNNVPLSGKPDSLKALSVISIAGHIEDNSGNLMPGFNGFVSPVIFDKENRVKTLANDGGTAMEFGLVNSIIFSGKTKASSGKFRFTFIVPREINYAYGNGKISYYANDEEIDMNGSTNGIVIGGFTEESGMDNSGPAIELYMNDTLFRDGGLTDMNPSLLAILDDPGGINITGSAIGHDLTGYLDGDREHAVILNSWFENDFDSYRKGRVKYKLPQLETGEHKFTLKAWDNFNNSSEKTINFVVESGDKFILRNLFCYPNPVVDGTRITGEINRPSEHIALKLGIFDLNGALIRSSRSDFVAGGFSLEPIEWDGRDERGNRVAQGMYIFVVTASTEKGETARASGRMIIL
ncbi:MAG TPA: type IX secretion system sortase PorU [Bacteroidales bacterium]|nr:type IX secretion system sortase PorU [Bacteroidales bacterium]